MRGLRYFVVEHLRTARRLLRAIDRGFPIDDCIFSELSNKNQGSEALRRPMEWLRQGLQVGLMSEAGCPGIADPGSQLVAACHEAGIQVQPLSGPSSIPMALMASGMNGQGFCFHGYLPVKEPGRSNAIKKLEQQANTSGYAQLFMETPYRNVTLFQALMQTLHPETRLCIASGISGKEETIRTQSVKSWKRMQPSIHKIPSIFIIG